MARALEAVGEGVRLVLCCYCVCDVVFCPISRMKGKYTWCQAKPIVLCEFDSLSESKTTTSSRGKWAIQLTNFEYEPHKYIFQHEVLNPGYL